MDPNSARVGSELTRPSPNIFFLENGVKEKGKLKKEEGRLKDKEVEDEGNWVFGWDLAWFLIQ